MDGSEGTHVQIGGHTVLLGSELRHIGSKKRRPASAGSQRRPSSAGSQVSHRHGPTSDDQVLSAQDIHSFAARWAAGPWPVLEERRTVIVHPQQPAGEDGVVRIPHLVGGKLEKHRDNDEWVLVVETCHQCECHRQEWLRHDPQDYRSGLEVVRSACRALDGARPVHCFHLETPDLGQRIGAFEVFLLPPRICEPAYFAYLVHSKLLTRKWPSHQSLVHRLRDDMPRLDHRGWKLALHGLKSNLDIFSCWKKAQEEVKHLEAEMGELASHAEKRVADLEQQLSELPEVQYQVEQLEDEKSDLLDQLRSCQQDCDAAKRRGKDLEREMQQMKESSLVTEGELKRQLQKTLGCGFGALADLMATEYGVEVTGVTLSEDQHAYAKKHFKNPLVDIRLQDYRSMTGQKFDRIYSVGIFEHIGRNCYETYFEKCQELLKDDGIMVIHSIGFCRSGQWNHGGWMNSYIFPGAELPTMSHFTQNFQEKWHLEDWQSFGVSYAKTLRAWKDNLNNWKGLEEFDERFRRMWEYYLMCCAASFQARRTKLWQLVYTKYPSKRQDDCHHIRQPLPRAEAATATRWNREIT